MDNLGESLQGKKVLVTGAGGFIGSHLTERLVELGAKVRALVRYNSRNDHGLIELIDFRVRKEIEVIRGDLRDFETVWKTVKGQNVVFHLGAQVSIPYSYLHPTEVVQTNIMGTLNVMNAAKECQPQLIVHTSSSEVYGTAQYVPIDENHPLQGQSPYSASKIGADKIAESFQRSFDLPVVTLRPFNTYGPRQSARAVTPTIIVQALLQDKVYLGSLHPTRDLTYVADIVDGFISVTERQNLVGEVINIGSGMEISIANLANKILSLMGVKADIVTDQKRVRPAKSEVERLLADTSKAKRLLHWNPQVSLEEGLGKTIQWVKENLERYKIELYNL